MSLNWKMPDNFNKKLIWRTVKKNDNVSTPDDITTDEEVIVQPELECLIFATMALQYDLQGEMTDAKLKEISRRLTLLNGIDALPTYYCSSDDGKHKKIKLGIEAVIRYWGLSTNVSHLSETKWNTYLIKVSKPNEYEFKYEKEEALKAIKEFPDFTEGDRLLEQWKNENLTTPSPTL